MSEAKFTKGKWSASCVKANGKEVRNGWGVDVGGFTLAAVYTGPTFGVVHEQQKANAHLIAVAPEMYAMLQALRDECEMFYSEFGEPSNGEYTAAFCDVDKLLAKARGEL